MFLHLYLSAAPQNSLPPINPSFFITGQQQIRNQGFREQVIQIPIFNRSRMSLSQDKGDAWGIIDAHCLLDRYMLHCGIWCC